jgi:hypothetical protein
VVTQLGIGGLAVRQCQRRDQVQADPSAVFGHCRAAVDAVPGAKINIFDATPEGTKRDAIKELTKRIRESIHSGRHVVRGTASEQAGEFPVDQRDALFVYNMTKLLISQIHGLVLRGRSIGALLIQRCNHPSNQHRIDANL